MISWEDQDETDTPDSCAMPAATLALAAAVGGALGLIGAAARMWFWPYRVFYRRTGTRP